MNALESNLVAPGRSEFLRERLEVLRYLSPESQVEAVCAFLNVWTKSFRVLDTATQSEEISALLCMKTLIARDPDFRLVDFEVYGVSGSVAERQPRDTKVARLRSRLKERREDLRWLEASIDHIADTGQQLHLPPRSEYFHFNYGVQRLATYEMQLGLELAKVSGD